jgi:NADPH-dependent 2,4-dienoyl-CoA reductase/sulfur reductase-like enzyme
VQLSLFVTVEEWRHQVIAIDSPLGDRPLPWIEARHRATARRDSNAHDFRGPGSDRSQQPAPGARPTCARPCRGRGWKSMADAIVTGAGPNGLAAANVLADAGWRVEIFEAQGELGGAVRSARGVDPAFVSDLFSSFHPLAVASPAIRALRLERFGLS